MQTVRYSKPAERDLAEILNYTKQRWNQAQADTYFQELADTFNLLARYQNLGRPLSLARPTWRRFEETSHVLLYRPIRDGIRIERIIHKRQLIELHLH